MQSEQGRLLSGEILLYSSHEEDSGPYTEGSRSCPERTSRMRNTWMKNYPSILQEEEYLIKMNVIQCYAPTNNKDKEMKDGFNNSLQSIPLRYPEKWNGTKYILFMHQRHILYITGYFMFLSTKTQRCTNTSVSKQKH